MLPFRVRIRALLRSCLLVPLIASAPAFAGASSGVDSIACGGHESSSSLFGALFLQCSGNLALDGGKLVSKSAVTIHADGALSLKDLSIQAPLIELVSDGTLSFTGASSIDGLAWNIAGGDIVASGRHTPAPVVLSSGSTVFDGLPGHPVATPSEISWEIFGVPGSGSFSSLCFDLPGFGRLGLGSSAGLLDLYFDSLALGADLKNGSGSIFIEVAGKGGALITINPVPEPGTWALMLAGLLMVVVLARQGRPSRMGAA